MINSGDRRELLQALEYSIGGEIEKKCLSIFAPNTHESYEMYVRSKYQIEGMRMAIDLIKEYLKEL